MHGLLVSNLEDGGYVATSNSGGQVSLTSKGTGTSVDWHLTESVIYDSTDFTSASFTVTDNGMGGGMNDNYALYSYAIVDNGGYDLNGNLLKVTDSVMGNWYYGYDNLNRLVSASSNSGYYANAAMSWSHDAFGNRMSETQGGSPSVPMPTSSSATYNVSNQLTTASQSGGAGFVYDAAGDVTNDGANMYLYDAEGRICAVNTANNINSPHPGLIGYVYDAAGIRVAKGTLTQFTCDFNPADTSTYNGFAATNSWTLGQGGEQIGEWQLIGGAWTWQHSNVSAGKLLGTYDTKGLHFYFNDWLGTRRIQTNALGQLEETCRSLPYGNGLNCTPTSLATAEDPTEQHFTGKERDTESGNDYFGARYYSSAMGRWMSPDWSAKAEPVPYAKLDDPQSLNLYSYVGNNPLRGVDTDGHVDVAAMCKGQSTCHVQVEQTAKLYSQDKKGNMVLDATLKVTTNFTVTSNDKGAITSVMADTSVQQVSGRISLSDEKLGAMAQTIADVQGLGVGSGLGPNTTQMLTAVADVEGKFGTEKNGRGQPANKDPRVNPLQLSGRRETWNRDANILGGIGVLKYFGGSSDPQATYQGFRGAGLPTAPFSDVYSGINEKATQ